MIKIIKKNGEIQVFNGEKIRKAVRKSANRVCLKMTPEEEKHVIESVRSRLKCEEENVSVELVHNMVEVALESVNPRIAKSYREYRDNKNAFASMLDKVYSKKLSLNFVGDRSNANADSSLVTTKKAIVYNELNSELYSKFFLTSRENRAIEDGFIYIHDKGSRLDGINCCISNMKNLLTGGFFMGNLDYSEPHSLAVAFDLIGDVTMNAASAQYGGFTIPQIDKLLAPYAELSYTKYLQDFKDIAKDNYVEKEADEWAYNKVKRDFEQGFQSWEMKFNSVASSRGDYPFTALTFGLGTGRWETLASTTVMKVRKEGQGKAGFKHPVLFPKLSMFYDEELHGVGKPLEWLFEEAIDCSSKTMYPDYISLTGDGFAPSIYKKYGVPISRMGCLDYNEKIEVRANYDTQKGEYSKTPIISESTIGVFYDNVVKILTRKKTFKNWISTTFMNQWAVDFEAKNGRKPTNGDSRKAFGHKIISDKVNRNRQVDKKLFDLRNNYFELCIIDELKALGAHEVESEEEAKERNDFVRNVTIYNDFGKAVSVSVYFPKRFFGYDIIKLDEEPQTNKRRKRKATTFEAKKEILAKSGIDLYPITKEDMSAEDYTLVYNAFGDRGSERKPHTDVIDLEENATYIGKYNLYVKDIDGQFVRIKKLIKNYNVTDWLVFEFDNGKKVTVTSDHPFMIHDGYVLADELVIGNYLLSDDDKELIIRNITPLKRICCSYDVETESGTFVFSHIQSHNCRAQTSAWYERGGFEPADEEDKPIFDGRFNMGAISLNFPMIVAKAQRDSKDFFEVFDYYLEMVRGIHKRTVEYISHIKAGTNPLGFCQGLFLNGNKGYDEELGREFLKPMTISFGVVGLNEASVLATGKKISEDNSWAISVMKYINEYANKWKKVDGILYAIYGTPAESLCHTFVEKFRHKYGIIKEVSDHVYITNSFHCGVRDDITPIEKQDVEYSLFHLCNGGNIQYVRYKLGYNLEAIRTLVRRAMKMGFYEGVNLSLNYCEDCGHSFVDGDVCPKCGSKNLTRIERMNGYLSYSKVRGRTMYSDHKLEEFDERVSM